MIQLVSLVAKQKSFIDNIGGIKLKSKKILAFTVASFVALQSSCPVFAGVSDSEMLRDVRRCLESECTRGRKVRFINPSEIPDDIVPMKLNSVDELKDVLCEMSGSSADSLSVLNSAYEGTCEYKKEFSRAGNTFGLLVTASYDVKNGDIAGPHLPEDWYFKSANGYLDLMGICINKRFENSSTSCDFSYDSPEMRVCSSGTLVSYYSVAGQNIEARDPIMCNTTFYAYDH